MTAHEPLDDLVATATAWHDQDPDESTRAELATLICAAETGDTEGAAELSRRFATRLEFGTAGLRGELGAGSTRMNRVLVAQAAAGLAAYLLEKSREPSIVIGYDGRKNSDVFARDTAELMSGAGVRAILLPRMLPTPVLAFAVRHLDASAGVMVTASHNPARDNGYKVYLGGLDHGSQIVSPADGEIAAHIARVAAELRVPDLPRSNDVEIAADDVVDEYVRRTAALASPSGRPPTPVKVVYTAMHGVGWEVASRVFAEAGFAEPVVVREQIEPDAAFPTVAFPNPEEPGALDLAFATATEAGADLVMANDPDADRLAVAIPDGAGGWRRLSGNDVGSLLGWRAAERIAVVGSGTMAASLVSSPALAAVASQYHVDYAETLTGFKWISRVGGLAFGYEEALGYLVDPDKVLDKDGISAAVDFLSLVTELAEKGRTIADHELAFAEKFGAFASSQISIRVSDLADISTLMARLRDAPPAQIAGIPVARIDDFASGFGQYPPGDILRIVLDDDARVIVRPSGTEPKLKVYIDASAASGTGAERRAAAEATVAALDAAVRELLA
ncbi:MAG: phospho-sugar mutase [Microbacteriaceae bacterium]|nr:phospho-sugar mutase [Microbacteriaceae bacterium]